MSTPALPDLTRYASALIIKPSSMGDIVHALPAVRCLKRAYPHLRLRWLCNTEWTPLLEGNSDLEAVVPFARARFRGMGLAGVVPWVWKFNRAGRELPEIALDFQGLLRSALLGRARGANPVVGLSDAREGASFFHKQIVPVNAAAHAVDRCLAMPRAFGAATDEIEFPLPEGSAPKTNEPLPKDFILVHPFARGEGKSMDAKTLQVLCECLAPQTVVLAGKCGTPVDVQGRHVISLVNRTTLGELLWLLRRARFVVSVDSGPMHLAAALRPQSTLGIHTWSDPRRVGPYDERAWVWKAGRIAHRSEFTDAEVAAHTPFGPGEARTVANVVLQPPAAVRHG